MNKQITPIVAVAAIVAAVFAGVAMPAAAQELTAQRASGTYNWLHPKLGFVKVDRATGAMVHSYAAANQSTQPKARSSEISLPKGKTSSPEALEGPAAGARN